MGTGAPTCILNAYGKKITDNVTLTVMGGGCPETTDGGTADASDDASDGSPDDASDAALGD